MLCYCVALINSHVLNTKERDDRISADAIIADIGFVQPIIAVSVAAKTNEA